MNLILASASPRRRQLLAQITSDFEVVAANVDESPGFYEVPGLYALRTAEAKGMQVSRQYPGALVLGADTIVCQSAEIFGKPRDLPDNQRMLAILSGGWHIVGTAVVLVRGGNLLARQFVVTRVLFRSLDANEIREYVHSGEGLDKAGGYGIQGLAGKFVAAIDGCYYNVVGLPLAATSGLLKQLL